MAMTMPEGWHGILALPGSRALLVGCGQHVEGTRLPTVPAVDNTLTDLGNALITSCGIDSSHLRTLRHPESPREFATALEEAAAEATDTLLIYYIGHGLVGRDHKLYLATRQTRDLSRGIASQQALSYSDVIPPLINSSSQPLAIVMLDCCFAGAAQGATGHEVENAFEATWRPSTYLLTATGADTRAWAPSGQRYTAFTGELIRLLRDGFPVGPPWMTVDDLYYALDQSLARKGLPRPRRKVSGPSDRRPMAVNRAYQAPVPPRLPGAADGGGSPYQGLESFGPAQAQFFFGRDGVVSELTDRIAGQGGRLVVMTGPSGSGKSSVLGAGLMTALEQGQVPGRTRSSMLLTPGTDPAGNLESRLGGASGAHLDDFVLIVDQFEELFAGQVGESERQDFITRLSDVAQAVPVVISIRGDFFGYCTDYSDLLPALRMPVIVGPMTRDGLTQVIEGPARRARLALQEGLTERILRDLGTVAGSDWTGAAGTLPFLSYALLATWQHRENDVLTLSSYQASGGVDGAVARAADATIGNLATADLQAVKQMLTRLVHVGVGSDDVRRSAPLAELLPPPGDARHDAARDVLNRLIAARLLTVAGNDITITHEALIRAWPQLRAWIDENRAGQVVVQQVEDAAVTWDRERRDPGALYRGQRLAIAREWAASPANKESLGALGREFLDASIASDLLTQRTEHRRRRQRRSLAILLVILLLGAAAASGDAFRQTQTARAAAQSAAARELLAKADALRDLSPRTSLLLGLGAMAESPSSDARANLLTSLSQSQYLGSLPAPTGEPFTSSLAFSPRGSVLAGGYGNGDVILWDPASHRHISTVRPTGAPVGAVAFSPDGSLLAVGSGKLGDTSHGTVTLYNADNPEALRVIAKFTSGDDPSQILFSASAPLVLVSGLTDLSGIWDISDPGAPRKVLGQTFTPVGPVDCMALRPDGRQLAIASDDDKKPGDSEILLYGVSSRGALSLQDTFPYNGPGSGAVTSVTAIGYGPDGTTLAASRGPYVRVWNIAHPRNPTVTANLNDHSDSVSAIAFSSLGELATSGQDDVTYAYTPELENPATYTAAALPSHDSAVFDVAFSPNGQTAATAGNDGTISLWRAQSLAGPTPSTAYSVPTQVNAAAYAPDGAIVAIAGTNSTVEIRDARSGSNLDTVVVPTDNKQSAIATINASGVLGVTFSRDGTTLATTSIENAALGGGGLVMLWNASDPHDVTHLATLDSPSVAYSTATFSPDGRTLAVGGAATAKVGTEGVVGLFDIAAKTSPRQVAAIRLPSSALQVNSVAFSPDGREMAVGANASNSQAGRAVSLWDVSVLSHPRLIGYLPGVGSDVEDVDYSHDGKMLAIATSDGDAQLWNVGTPASPSQLSILAGHTGIVRTVAFSANDQSVVAGGDDRTAIIWDITDPTDPVQIAKLTGQSGSVNAQFTPSGHAVLTTSLDGTAVTWPLSPLLGIESDPSAAACAILGPTIKADEWSLYLSASVGHSLCRN